MAPQKIKLLCDLNRHIQQNGDLVWLLGVPWMPWTIVSAVRCMRSGDPADDFESGDLQAVLPGGVEVIGVLLVSDRPDPAKAYAEIGPNILKNTSDDFVVATCTMQRADVQFHSRMLELIEHEQFASSSASEQFWQCTSLIHSQMQVNFLIYASSEHSSDYEQQFVSKIKDTTESFTSPKIVCLLEGPANKIVIRSQNEKLADLFPVRMSTNSIPQPLEMKVLMQQCSNLETVPAPVILYTSFAEGTMLNHVSVSLDVLCLLPSNCAVSKTKQAVVRALSSQLEVMGKSMVKKNGDFRAKLYPHHFIVPGVLHPITGIYDLSQPESASQSVEVRKALHFRLGLPLDRPLLRIANSLTIRGAEILANTFDGGKRLLDVHAGLSRCGIPGGQLSIVDGSYEYYHYLQDRCDDKGWGCAYRSLQTIISWFRLQHYTSVPVPSHRDVQATLVEIGDKEASFVGSEDWIGAIELSFVLDKLLGVTSKILNVRSGAELPEKCRELAAHFDTQGTPVMIGGGVLAYTLLGVDYNELTGESAFLILDPHYTGGEDLKTIRSGGWCGWKRAVSETTGQEFFLRNKFYNLLLPQRPQTV